MPESSWHQENRRQRDSPNYASGISAHGTTAASYVRGFHIEGNMVVGNGNLGEAGTQIRIGGAVSSENIVLIDNYTYMNRPNTTAPIGKKAATNSGLEARRNYFVGGSPAVRFDGWAADVIFTDNFLVTDYPLVISTGSAESVSNISWDSNTYFSPLSAPFSWDGESLTPTEWKKRFNFDQQSTHLSAKPSGQTVFVRPNFYEPGRANIIVYNWDLKSSAVVDLSDVLQSGANFEVRNANDFFGAPVLRGTYRGGGVTLPLTGLSVAQPVGLSKPANLAPEIGVFVVLSDCAPITAPEFCEPEAGHCWHTFIEAETQSMTAPTGPAADATASGGMYVRTTSTTSGSVDFSVDVAEAGQYIIWARVLAPSASSDSFFVSANGGDEDIYDAAEGTWSAQWQWTRLNGRNGTNTPGALNPRIFAFDAGINTLSFRSREAGAALDVILVTNDAYFVPTGIPCVDGRSDNGACSTGCTPMSEICDDGIDNDCDGDIDAADTNCQGDTDVDVVCPENHIQVNPEAVRPDEFTVIINDKDGNPVTCARVELDPGAAGCSGSDSSGSGLLLFLSGLLVLVRRFRKN
ncbi:MAG: hypothetical protein R3C68_14580 [Myxococcota bacterium]